MMSKYNAPRSMDPLFKYALNHKIIKYTETRDTYNYLY